MCGIFGNYCFREGNSSANSFSEMANLLSHRGPDNSGFHHTDKYCLGNTRLSIIDLRNNSNQPIFSEDKKIILGCLELFFY